MNISPYFPPDVVLLPDEMLGKVLFGAMVRFKADDIGLSHDRISPYFVNAFRKAILDAEADSAEDAAVEKALHKAAKGDYAAAGRLIREYMIGGAVRLKFASAGINRLISLKKYGEAGAEQKHQLKQKNIERVRVEAQKILDSRTKKISNRALGELVSKRIDDISFDTCRKHIAELKRSGKIRY